LRVNAVVAAKRLANQGITTHRHRRAADVVAWSGAVQAQEYEPAKWGLGLRLPDDAVDADVERAFTQGRLLRTHVMRPTWHFVTPADIRWLLALTGPRVQRLMALYNGRHELDARTLSRGLAVFERALRDGHYLTRRELGERLARARMPMAGMRLGLLAMHAEQEAVICSGPRRGRQFTYALLEERVPATRPIDRDEALGELCRRFFRSHGPATVRDFVWWSGLLTSDAKRGLEIIKARALEGDGLVYWELDESRGRDSRDRLVALLPIYDEYLVAYRDRAAVSHGPAVLGAGEGGAVRFLHAMVIAGQVAGTWRTARAAGGITLQATLLRPLTARERKALAEEVDRYARFLGTAVTLAVV
jgi:hypothetical protein